MEEDNDKDKDKDKKCATCALCWNKKAGELYAVPADMMACNSPTFRAVVAACADSGDPFNVPVYLPRVLPTEADALPSEAGDAARLYWLAKQPDGHETWRLYERGPAGDFALAGDLASPPAAVASQRREDPAPVPDEPEKGDDRPAVADGRKAGSPSAVDRFVSAYMALGGDLDGVTRQLEAILRRGAPGGEL